MSSLLDRLRNLVGPITVPHTTAQILIAVVTIAVIFFVREIFFQGDQYQRAKDLLHDKHYNSAASLFLKVYHKQGPIADYALFYAGESLWLAKHRPAAARYLQQFVKDYVHSPYLDRARYRLAQFKIERKEILTTDERIIFAKGLYNEREYGPASLQFQEALRQKLTAPQRGEAWHFLGVCHLALREYSLASNALITAMNYPHPLRPRSLWWLAQTYKRQGRSISAIARYKQFYTTYPTLDLAAQAIVNAAELYSNMRQPAEAAALYRLLRVRYPYSRLGGESYWREGRDLYRSGNYRAAYRQFTEGALRAEDSPYGAALYFWSGNTALKMGNTPNAQTYFKKTVELYDHNYYVYRAAAKGNIPMPALKTGKLPWSVGRSPWGDRYQTLLVQKAYDDAYAEIENMIATADATVKMQTYYELAAAALSKGAYFEGLVQLERVLLLRAVPIKDFPYSFWRMYYPRPFHKFIRDAARRHHVPVELILGVIREESLFDPRSLSWVGARGLMQLMPGTAQVLLKRKEYPLEILYEPKLNIELGTKYLDQLLRDVKGEEALALAGYNAGPHAVSRWLRARPIQDLDEWIEMIPYEETREYVKRVLRSFWEYKRIY